MNLVFLTAREHYICHKLLTKFTNGAARRKMIFAWHRMRYRRSNQLNIRITSHDYEQIKTELSVAFSENNKGRFIGNKHPMFGKKHTVEAIERMAPTFIKKGQHFSITTEIKKGQHLSKSTEFKNGGISWMKGKKHSESAKQKCRDFWTAEKRKELGAKIRLANEKKKAALMERNDKMLRDFSGEFRCPICNEVFPRRQREITHYTGKPVCDDCVRNNLSSLVEMVNASTRVINDK